MTEVLSLLIYVVVIVAFAMAASKKKKARESSSIPHEHAKPGQYVSYNKKNFMNTAGAQPHVHEARKYTSMSDASKLPPGYILLNGEPVRVADLEGK